MTKQRLRPVGGIDNGKARMRFRAAWIVQLIALTQLVKTLSACN
jgi:hypothetical protein